MQPKAPVGPNQEFTQEALNKKFSYSFTRAQLIALISVLRPIQLPLNDFRTRSLITVIDEIERTALQSITENDYVQPEKGQAEVPLAPATPKVQIN